MEFIKGLGIYIAIGIGTLVIRILLMYVTFRLDKRCSEKYAQSQKTPSGILFWLFVVSYFTTITIVALVDVPLLYIVSSWDKVFSVVLALTIFGAILISLFTVHSLYLEKGKAYKNIKAPIIWSVIVNQVVSNIFILIAVTALEVSFDMNVTVSTLIQDAARAIVLVIGIVNAVKACKENSRIKAET